MEIDIKHQHTYLDALEEKPVMTSSVLQCLPQYCSQMGSSDTSSLDRYSISYDSDVKPTPAARGEPVPAAAHQELFSIALTKYMPPILTNSTIVSNGVYPIFDSPSSVGSGCSTTDEVDFTFKIDNDEDSLQALIAPRLHCVSQTMPLYKSMSSNSLLQLRNSNLGPVRDTVPCTQNAPLDSSTLKIWNKAQLPELQRTSSLPSTEGSIDVENQSVEASPSHSEVTKHEEAKVIRYSEEERKIRIERYRKKRSQRNFQKKIKYACRKTLADSRPRVRGRFAKNYEEPEKLNMEDAEVEAISDKDRHCISRDYLAYLIGDSRRPSKEGMNYALT